MGDFITDPASTLPASTIGVKTDKRAVPIGASATDYVRAADINEHTARIDAAHSALLDTRTAVLDPALGTSAAQAVLADPVQMSAASVTPTGGTTARTNADRFADVVNVRDFGAKGDGVTDDSAAFVLAIASTRPIYGPDGTYILDTVAISGDCTITLSDGATLKHKAASTNHMIVFTGTRLRIQGGTIDGNQAAQTARRYGLNLTVSTGTVVEVDGVRFTDSQAAAIAAFAFGGVLDVQRCVFSGMAEHDNVAQHFTCAVYVGSGEAGSRGLCRFNHNRLIGTNAPTYVGGAPGGLFFAPTTDYLAGEGNFSTLEAIGNWFWGIGQNCNVNDIAAIHTYPVTDGARIVGNYFEQCGFSAIAAKSVQNCVIANNVIVNGQVNAKNDANSGAIYYTPGDHAASYSRPRAVITGNIVDTPGGESATAKQYGISVIGTDTSLADDVVVSGNVLNGCGIGIGVDYVTDVTVHGNMITGATGGTANTESGIRVDHAFGTVRISGNKIAVANGYGLFASVGINTATFIVDDNYVDCDTAGSYALLVRGAAVAKFTGNLMDSVSGAISVTTDGANAVGLLIWNLSNKILAGTFGIIFAQVTSCYGHIIYTNAPEGLVAASPGTLYTRTSGAAPVLYLKMTGAGNTGWRQVTPDGIGADRGDTDKTLTPSTDYPIQRWATTLTENRTITLATGNASSGDRFRIVRTGLGAYTLDVGGLKTIPASTAAFVDVMFDGSAWVLTGYGTL